MHRLEDFDYELPQELIAERPAEPRDAARLMVVNRTGGTIAHHHVRDLPELLAPNDCLVLNDTRVVPARLFGRRVGTGGKWEGLFLHERTDGTWALLCRTRGRLRAGERIAVVSAHRPAVERDEHASLGAATRAGSEVADGTAANPPEHADELHLELVERGEEGVWFARVLEPGMTAPPDETDGRFDVSRTTQELLQRYGTMPLPPYIRRDVEPSDWERYQTTYAHRAGSVAAPTAGLHFTPQLFARLGKRGVQRCFVTLHVGLGTFRPIATEQLDRHRMHSEICEVTPQTVRCIEEVRRRGGRCVAVGTTTVRTLETASRSGRLQPFRGSTDLFIRPPFQFHTVDALLTNFHLPRSTLLVLVSAFAGLELIRRAYEVAVEERYRFYSYGDAMLIL
ncbi:MAG: tRNA preQ1(34) S-adenosylmethionine ribosyltransferase-isomerase QueA [Planctomycetota bacterium]|nr:MAG: tRNA preQ1(34) S-adenosylmethionine ribosyltransferase-isomerase QueA [Planctomycetota bacterium]